MPIGYLWTTAIVGWCTLFAVAARRPKRPQRSSLSYWFAFLINELPFIAAYWLLASTLLAAGQGDLSSPVGWVAFAIAVITMLGLALVAWRGTRARSAVQAALDEGLGADWRTAVDPGSAARLDKRLRLAPILFAPFSVRRRDVERVANVSYGDAGKWNLLDVYRRRSHPTGCPTFVYLHGGTFRRGRKNNEARLLLYRLASRGWLCVSANYRLSPAARFPDHLVDVKKVIAWVREHGREYGADPSVLLVAGSSAGGNLASTAALTPNEARFQPGFEVADTSVTAAVSLYGYYGHYHQGTDNGNGSSPLGYVQADAPPFFVAHGDRDTLVPFESARAFVETLQTTSSSPVVYAELPGAQHTFDLFRSIRFERVVEGIEAFAAWARARA
ncbi:MAG TPA: alpha/beta hydrolase [Gaiellaceae bacterium]